MLVVWFFLIGLCQITRSGFGPIDNLYLTFAFLGASLYLECTHHLRCSEADRIKWLELREHVRNLVKLGNLAREDGYILESAKFRRSLQYRDFLCAEYRISGFFLQNASNYNLQVACLWVGGEMNASCGLVPSSYKPFGYYKPQKWRQMLFVS
ncbi:unnamed protein product [Thelazia callipaeda]|uniref:SLATT_5 domain-containing protein n=1 Tax=Thelazia callipaeda TaxID=103827 RepID=A0A0N5CQP7_THECL|nr:unnamed protein product [Thelazia callipaeda]